MTKDEYITRLPKYFLIKMLAQSCNHHSKFMNVVIKYGGKEDADAYDLMVTLIKLIKAQAGAFTKLHAAVEKIVKISETDEESSLIDAEKDDWESYWADDLELVDKMLKIDKNFLDALEAPHAES